MQLIVRSDGAVRCVYGEDVDLRVLGRLEIKRGSHVEPIGDGQWIANMSPVDGPLLGPFARRSDALKAERQWLERHWLK